ncbi:MAG: hypothetical protein GYA61_00640 [Spirochaetales bacterium]|jgi:uncharacterized membrane protein YeaQ/YmgE (transglycosylase-associated protein family)|nr:hypothetical protein [Exilispira sp.]NMC66711.1 hypothetical protein [Spirochaetales bacterium]
MQYNILNDPVIRFIFHILFYSIIGFGSALYFYYFLKKKFNTNFWFLLAVFFGLIGAALGSYFLNDLFKILTQWPLGINTLATLFGAFFLIGIYSFISSIKS